MQHQFRPGDGPELYTVKRECSSEKTSTCKYYSFLKDLLTGNEMFAADSCTRYLFGRPRFPVVPTNRFDPSFSSPFFYLGIAPRNSIERKILVFSKSFVGAAHRATAIRHFNFPGCFFFDFDDTILEKFKLFIYTINCCQGTFYLPICARNSGRRTYSKQRQVVYSLDPLLSSTPGVLYHQTAQQ